MFALFQSVHWTLSYHCYKVRMDCSLALSIHVAAVFPEDTVLDDRVKCHDTMVCLYKFTAGICVLLSAMHHCPAGKTCYYVVSMQCIIMVQRYRYRQ